MQLVEVPVSFDGIEGLALLGDVEEEVGEADLRRIVVKETMRKEVNVGVIGDAIVDGHEALPGRVLLFDRTYA